MLGTLCHGKIVSSWLDLMALCSLGTNAVRSCSEYEPPLGHPPEFSRPGMGGAGRDNPAARGASSHGSPNGRLLSNSGTKSPAVPKVSSIDKKVASAKSALALLAQRLSSLPTGACTHDELLGGIELQNPIQQALGTDSVRQLIACIEQSAEADRVSDTKCTSRAWYKEFVAHLISVLWRAKDPSFTPKV